MVVDVKSIPTKKTESSTVVKEKNPVNFSQVVDFVGDVKQELSLISWTSLEELRVYTKIVVGATFILGLGVYFLDLLIHSLLSGLSVLLNLVS